MPNGTTGEFSSGILIPFQANGAGGIKLVDGDDYLRQIVRVRVAPGNSDNPFLSFGIADDAVFQNVSDTGWRSVIRRRIENFFQTLQRAQLVKLLSVAFQPSTTSPEEFDAVIRFLSIETNTEQEVKTPIRRT